MASKKEKELKAAIEKGCQEIENRMEASYYLQNIITDEITKYIPSDMQGGFKNMISYVEKFSTVMKYHELPKKEYKGYSIKELERGRVEETKEPIDKELFEQAKVNTQIFLASMELILQQDAEYKDLTFAELKEQSIDPKNKTLIAGSTLDKLFKAAEKNINKNEIVALDNIKGIKPNDLKLPVSKLHNNIFDSLFNENGQISGQISFLDPTTFDSENENNNLVELCVGSSKDAQKTDRLILYGIDQDDLEGLSISREIDSFDQRVYDAICTLYECGNKIITMGQIYYAMGGKSNLSQKTKENINKSVVKLWSTKVFVDETKDYEKYLPKDGKIKHRGRILNISFKDAYIHNKYVESAIVLLEEPYILQFSKRRNQVEAIPRNVIETSNRMTVKSLAIENYLLTRISRMKSASRNNRKNTSNRILFDSIIEKAHEKNKPQRVIDTARKFLDHYQSKNVNWIIGYKEKDGYFEIEV